MKRLSARDGIDPRELRDALGRFATGVTVITTRTDGGKIEGMTANSFSALSLDPPLVLWSIRNEAPSLPSFLESGRFAINVLSCDQKEVSGHFATPQAEKFDGLDFRIGEGGCPVFEDSLAIFECETEKTVEGGDHLIFIGRVVHVAHRDGEPLLFNAGKYCIPASIDAETGQNTRMRA